ncbi:MAG: hypothetical protein NTZ25_01670 [Candidatus Peregrinibacteria bacterium]|nr:hypothetical protein [Candidatus Peregrinibacteria bacterium]
MESSIKVGLEFDHREGTEAAIAERLEQSALTPDELREITQILQQAGQRAPAILKALETVKAPLATTSAAESVDLDPRLTTFKTDFDSDPALQSKISWAEIQTRLLANEGHYLALAQAMEQGGQLFGFDKQGNPLISDRGDEPVMKGMNYKNTRDRVKYKHTSNDKRGTKILDEKQQPIATGYEMFGYNEPYGKSEEINQYETHTGKKFVQNSKDWRLSWLESGEKPSWPRYVDSSPRNADSFVDFDDPNSESDNLGVRRLLRVEKAA